MWKICFTTIILVALLTMRLCNGQCNVCNESNGAACTSKNTFQLCFNGRPQEPTYSCPNTGDVCTALGMICVDPIANSNIQAYCGSTKQCGNCNAIFDGGYACTSRKTFVMCLNNAASTVIGICPANEVCLTSRANSGVNPCANQCLSNIQDMCNIESPDATTVTASPPNASSDTTETTITTESPTTDSSVTTLSEEDTVCASQTLIGRYKNPNDPTCRTYIHCTLDRTTRKLVGRTVTCPGTRFFNPSINGCQDARPTDCTQ